MKVTKYSYILNIGLKTSPRMGGDGDFLHPAEVLEVLKRHRVEVVSFKQGNSISEPTLIVSCKAMLSTSWGTIAGALFQEAVAVYNCEILEGYIVGKYAHLWGEFNPAYFLI